MNKKLLVLLGIILVVSSKHLQSHYLDADTDVSHYAGYDDSYPSHYYDDDAMAHYYDDDSMSHYDYDDHERQHYDDQAGGTSGSQALFAALQNDPSVSSLLKKKKAGAGDYEKVKNSIITTLKGNTELQSKLADEMFGNGKIGALFNNEQRVKILNYVMDNPDIMKGGKAAAKAQVLNFVKTDPELSEIFNANKETFGH